jgi:hypothetical protein
MSANVTIRYAVFAAFVVIRSTGAAALIVVAVLVAVVVVAVVDGDAIQSVAVGAAAVTGSPSAAAHNDDVSSARPLLTLL